MRFSPLRSLALSPSSRALTLLNTGRSASTHCQSVPRRCLSLCYSISVIPRPADRWSIPLFLPRNLRTRAIMMENKLRTRHNASCTHTGLFACRSRQEDSLVSMRIYYYQFVIAPTYALRLFGIRNRTRRPLFF